MNEHLMTFVKNAFNRHDLHQLAQEVYLDLTQGDSDALYRLSRHLVNRGFVVEIRGHRLIAKAASARGRYPEQMIFDLPGEPTYRIGGVARAASKNTHYVGYYLDAEGSEELAKEEARYVDDISAATPHGPVEKDQVLRH